MLDGQPRDPAHNASRIYPVGPNITLEDVHLTYRGGGLARDAALDPPHGGSPPWPEHWFPIDVPGRVAPEAPSLPGHVPPQSLPWYPIKHSQLPSCAQDPCPLQVSPGVQNASHPAP